jgi:SAM-dependent methyltransferase
MRLTSAAESGLGVSREQIARLFEPFVDRAASADGAEWRAAVRERRRKTLWKLPRRLLPARQRSERNVVAEYARVWGPDNYARFSVEEPPPRFSPFEWAGERMLASTLGATRFRQLLLIRAIERVRPERVLEVGSGNGVNLMLLAGRFPRIAFTGVELTSQGRAAALGLQELPELPRPMQGFAPEPLEDPTAFRRVRFLQGSAAELPFQDGEFDLVITVLALEQMERIRRRALAEIARVARGHSFMIEPFADVNESLWPRLNVMRRDYFRGRIDELPGYGLVPVLATDDFPQESLLKVCAVLSEKRPDLTRG